MYEADLFLSQVEPNKQTKKMGDATYFKKTEKRNNFEPKFSENKSTTKRKVNETKNMEILFIH